MIDAALMQFVGGMPNAGGIGFRCPNGDSTRTIGTLLRFEHGFMMDLENSPAVYIYYDLNQEWERAVSSWRDGDPSKTAELEPPAPFLFQPANATEIGDTPLAWLLSHWRIVACWRSSK